MTKQQKELIQWLLSNAYVEKKAGLVRLKRNDDNQIVENMYQKEMKFIEETYKEVERIKCDD